MGVTVIDAVHWSGKKCVVSGSISKDDPFSNCSSSVDSELIDSHLVNVIEEQQRDNAVLPSRVSTSTRIKSSVVRLHADGLVVDVGIGSYVDL
jgi:hypothetical protein